MKVMCIYNCKAINYLALIVGFAADKKTSSGMAIVVINEVLAVQDPEDDDEDIKHTGTIICNYYKSVGVQSIKGGSKNFTCIFCDTACTGCSLSRVMAPHIDGRQFSGISNQILKLVYQYAKMITIGIHNSKLLKKFLTKK